jgi:hypothetical protein
MYLLVAPLVPPLFHGIEPPQHFAMRGMSTGALCIGVASKSTSLRGAPAIAGNRLSLTTPYLHCCALCNCHGLHTHVDR